MEAIKREISNNLREQKKSKVIIRSQLIIKEQVRINFDIKEACEKLFSREKTEIFNYIKKEILNMMKENKRTNIRIFLNWRKNKIEILIEN
jgi:hypothetical protein